MAHPRQRITQEHVISGGPARLIVLEGPQAGQKFKIDGDVVIGRAIDSSVVLEDPEVSRSHVRITRTPAGAYEIEDLGSRNGTQVHGVPFQKQFLRFLFSFCRCYFILKISYSSLKRHYSWRCSRNRS